MSREIDDLDFNGLRSKIIELIGTGSGSYGYGQDIKSSAVFQGNLITKNQWDGLRYDLINILVHQTGVTPEVIEIVKGALISELDPLLEFNELIESAKTTRFNIGSSRSSVSTIATKNFTTRWNTYAYTTVRLTFATANEARFFFNTGGKIRFLSSRSGGSSTAQNGAWTNFLNSVGTVEFGANSSGITFYELTNSYQKIFEQALSTPYSANVYRIQALCNVSNNSQGSATTVTFEIAWIDNYSETFPNTVVSPADEVDGTLSLNVVEVKAVGPLQPSGDFTVVSPIYEISDISAGYDSPPPPPPPDPEPYVPPTPPPSVNYNERVILPAQVVQDEPYELRVEGGAPNTDVYFEWRNGSGTLTSSGTVTLDGSGRWVSVGARAFITPDTYTITLRFSYTGNIRSASSTVTAPTYQEAIIVPIQVTKPNDFPVIITRGVPNTTFGYSLRYSSGDFIIAPTFFALDGSGNFSTSLPTFAAPLDTYTHTFAFIATNNVYYRTTRIV